MLYEILRPFLFRLDPERAHHLALSALSRTPLPALLGSSDALVERPVELWGLTFRNPLGLAAGFDKNGVALHAWRAMGFGFVEIGTVTRHRQPGNPRPRMFRCARERALVNRLGFPNDGAEAVGARLKTYREKYDYPRFPLGINIGKSTGTPLEDAGEDYLHSFRTLYGEGDFFVVNVSSPNTPGLRELQRPAQLRPILGALKGHATSQENSKPLLVKIAPDLDDREVMDLLELVDELGIDGVVATNTTVDHRAVRLDEKGGLSGAPLRQRSTELIRLVHRETRGELPVVGVGGVFTREDYLEKLDAGAALVELYTGFVYEGYRIVSRILRESGVRA
ncbi:MAG: quinone-dependent dihydroorotate dehydrogenase [Planctomycetota bacterium]|nr:quinone-dependent dihydroorotate dehydrogenase [Planctomycetota bacterium]